MEVCLDKGCSQREAHTAPFSERFVCNPWRFHTALYAIPFSEVFVCNPWRRFCTAHNASPFSQVNACKPWGDCVQTPCKLLFRGICVQFIGVCMQPLCKAVVTGACNPSKKCHEKGLALGKENLIFAGPIRMYQNALHQWWAISKICCFKVWWITEVTVYSHQLESYSCG